MDQSTICEGIGGITWGVDAAGKPGLVNVRQKYIQGYSKNDVIAPVAITAGQSWESVPNTVNPTPNSNATVVTRRYQIQLGTGLFTQEKLVSSIIYIRFLPNSWPPNWRLKSL